MTITPIELWLVTNGKLIMCLPFLWWLAFVTKYSLTGVIIQRLVLYDNITRQEWLITETLSSLLNTGYCFRFGLSPFLLTPIVHPEDERSRRYTDSHCRTMSALFWDKATIQVHAQRWRGYNILPTKGM